MIPLLASPKRVKLALGAAVAALALLVSLFVTAPWGVAPVAASANTILGDKAPRSLVEHSDDTGVEVGTRFSVRADGNATAMRFWKGDRAVGPHTGTLWSERGRVLATTTFDDETDSGWQTAEFDRPVTLEAGKTYVVSYYATDGRYAATHNFDEKSQSSQLTIKRGAGVFKYGTKTKFPTDTYRSSNYWVDVVFSVGAPAGPTTPGEPGTSNPGDGETPAPGDEETPAPEPTPEPTPAPTPQPEPAPTPAPTPTPAPSQGFPTAATTGVPAGTALTPYTGSCTITAPGTVIDAKQVNCSTLSIQAQNVVISRSVINGTVSNSERGTSSFTITDSEVHSGNQVATGIGDARFTATRVEVTGGNRSVNCALDCAVVSSYVHGQFRDDSGRAHESGIRMGAGSVIRGNTIVCDAPDVAPDAGCSAALTGYGDFAVVQNNVIDGNLFGAGSGGYCSYGGSTGGKPFSSGTRDIRFTNNVWQRGDSGKCGFYGPITSFDSNAPGNVWSNNTWDDGTPVRAAN